jgi:hypothetical protein
MEAEIVEPGAAQHNRQNGGENRNNNPQGNNNLPSAPEGSFVKKPPGDVSCQQTGNNKEYKKKPNHAIPSRRYSSASLFHLLIGHVIH